MYWFNNVTGVGFEVLMMVKMAILFLSVMVS
jgi:hypothetical protein